MVGDIEFEKDEFTLINNALKEINWSFPTEPFDYADIFLQTNLFAIIFADASG